MCSSDLARGASPGTYPLVATYSGDDADQGSVSDPLTVTVDRGASSLTLTSSANPSRAAAGVTFTATVAAIAPATGTPQGNVRFTITANGGGTVACKGGSDVTLSGGTASCTVAVGELAAANSPYTVTAMYPMGVGYTSSSSSLVQTVEPLSAT